MLQPLCRVPGQHSPGLCEGLEETYAEKVGWVPRVCRGPGRDGGGYHCPPGPVAGQARGGSQGVQWVRYRPARCSAGATSRWRSTRCGADPGASGTGPGQRSGGAVGCPTGAVPVPGGGAGGGREGVLRYGPSLARPRRARAARSRCGVGPD